MLFHTWAFVAFFAVAYPLYLILKASRLRLPCLLAISYFFYGCFNPLYPALIAYSTLIDYVAARKMQAGLHKRLWLAAGIVNNLALLGLFKYGVFFTDNVNVLLSGLGIPYALPQPGIILPVGLSFYIFQSMGYLIDCYRGDIEAEKSLVAYATFVSFFPRLPAGPIERASNLLPQFHSQPIISRGDAAEGLSLFVVGLFKKIALADYFALYVDKVYAAPGEFQSPALVLGTFLFAWQIYFDFSGYTDMARGIARLMGIRLMLNFDNPYLSTGLGEFWARWHISLSSWFKDYLYIPLGGNRKGMFNTYRNMFVTMVVSGLWHGAAWTFVLWGMVHALGRCLTRELERTAFYRQMVPKLLKQLLVFVFVSFAWIFFRAETIGDAWTIVSRIFSSGFADPSCPVFALSLVALVWVYQCLYESKYATLLETRPLRVGMVVLMILYMAVFAPSGEQAFIYLQF